MLSFLFFAYLQQFHYLSCLNHLKKEYNMSPDFYNLDSAVSKANAQVSLCTYLALSCCGYAVRFYIHLASIQTCFAESVLQKIQGSRFGAMTSTVIQTCE